MQAVGGACMAPSLLTPIGYQSGDCGYCRKGDDSSRTPDSRGSYYATTKSLCPTHYQMLMDRGWRRSGTLCYLPDPSRSCCPHYTIRLNANDFTPTRDQRQALNRWNRFVLGDDYLKQLPLKQPKTKSEKKASKTTFSLLPTLHLSESPHTHPDLTPAHTFTTTLEPDTFTQEKYSLFAVYQTHIHHEKPSEISPAGFKRFLCSSPLHRHPSPRKQGSYHHCYRLNGRLIAMAVLDLCPEAVSGVYFIYHPDFEKFSLGKISALREIGLAREEGYGGYYMGYYIPRCGKMEYKAAYNPDVLDFDTLTWAPLDERMREVMRERKWMVPSREVEISRRRNEEGCSEEEVVEEVYATTLPSPTAAAASETSILELGMPGTLPLPALLETVDLGAMKIRLQPGRVHEARDLVGWEEGGEGEKGSLRGVFAELAGCLGKQVAGEVVVDFARGV